MTQVSVDTRDAIFMQAFKSAFHKDPRDHKQTGYEYKLGRCIVCDDWAPEGFVPPHVNCRNSSDPIAPLKSSRDILRGIVVGLDRYEHGFLSQQGIFDLIREAREYLGIERV